MTVKSLQQAYEEIDTLDADAQEGKDEQAGHPCGHLFTITATSLGHGGISGEGPESHRDAPAQPDPITFVRQVRAYDLTTALRRAAQGGLVEWQYLDEDGTILDG